VVLPRFLREISVKLQISDVCTTVRGLSGTAEPRKGVAFVSQAQSRQDPSRLSTNFSEAKKNVSLFFCGEKPLSFSGIIMDAGRENPGRATLPATIRFYNRRRPRVCVIDAARKIVFAAHLRLPSGAACQAPKRPREKVTISFFNVSHARRIGRASRKLFRR